MFLLNFLHHGYSQFVDLLMEKDKKYTDKDIIFKMTMFGIILFLAFLSTYNMQYIVLALMSIGK